MVTKLRVIYHHEDRCFRDFINFLGSCIPIRLVEDEVYDEIVRVVNEGGDFKLPSSNKRTKVERNAWEALKKTNFVIKEVVNLINGRTEQRLCIIENESGKIVIVPRMREVNEIINYFYITYRKEGTRKLTARIEGSYAGISRDTIMAWVNRNTEHGLSKPTFTNKST